jgi:hypothetical protein
LETLKDGRHYLLQRHATLHNNAQHIFGLENLKDGRYYCTSCNATPPAQHCSAYIWFGKFKRWPPLPHAMPRHLSEWSAIFVFKCLWPFQLLASRETKFCILFFENSKVGRHYPLQYHAL